MTIVSVKTAADRAAKAGSSSGNAGNGDVSSAASRAASRQFDPAIMRVELSDGALFSFKTVYLPQDYDAQALCVPGRELSAEEAASLRYAAACFRAERAALQLIARAEQTSLGIARKLEHKGHEAAPVREAVSYLSSLEIISDRRYAELWLRSRLRHSGGKVSPRKLGNTLRGKGLSAGTVQKALKAALDAETESALLTAFAAANYPNPDRKDFSLKHKLKYEGFSAAAVQAFWEAL